MAMNPCYDPLGANDPDFIDPLGVNENPWDRERRLAAEGSSRGSQASIGSPDDNDILTSYSTNTGEFRRESVCVPSNRDSHIGSDAGRTIRSGTGNTSVGCGSGSGSRGSGTVRMSTYGSSSGSSHARYSWIYPSNEDLSRPLVYAGEDDTHRAWHPADGGEVPGYIYQGEYAGRRMTDDDNSSTMSDHTQCLPSECNPCGLNASSCNIL